jgi:hypothetical protein
MHRVVKKKKTFSLLAACGSAGGENVEKAFFILARSSVSEGIGNLGWETWIGEMD